MDVDLQALPDCSLEGIRVVELLGCDEAELQQFFEQAPDYFIAVNGEPATPTEAREELRGQLPAGWHCSRVYWLGYHGDQVALRIAVTQPVHAAAMPASG